MFVQGQKVKLLVHGAGTTSEEEAIVLKVENGIVTVKDSDTKYDAKTGKSLGKDNFFGFKFKIKEL
ncbi:hypothetical protein PP175_28545 (plasmid) [Aneurinibacillus sp. Ricciae_BoGa-3]|uniref:hypothetical protein n=1 Tax=Aneurinibacillus sp. Ricciae_BoGa-3 TaxID=3022697 RepID=UPI002341C6D1|nr:hypothetical protein [Aneurinibacillus sp. Ricciae_BoGa-3]WCK57141.1 hypothetical protein PP175_28545 [Aneurinibacillus sp. Ricciae_BoGa-3]